MLACMLEFGTFVKLDVSRFTDKGHWVDALLEKVKRIVSQDNVQRKKNSFIKE